RHPCSRTFACMRPTSQVRYIAGGAPAGRRPPSIAHPFGSGPPDSGDRDERLDLAQPELAVLDLGAHRVAGVEATVEQALGQRVLEDVLDQPAQRPGAVGVVVAVLAELVHRLVADLQ